MSKFIPFAFIIFLGLSCLAVIDIESDSLNCPDNIEGKEFLSEENCAFAESLGDFAVGCLEMLDGETLNASAKKHLIDSVRKNPEARLAIAILAGEWFKKGEYQECIDTFLPMAKEHPEAIDLNLSTASAMICLKKNLEAASLLDQCFNTILFPVEDKDKIKGVINLVACLGDLYGKLKMFDEGEKLFDKVLEDENMSKEYKIRTCAAVFFSLRADQGEDGFFSGWTKRGFRKKMDENLEACETIWNGLLQSSSVNKTKLPPVLELVPVLEINRRYNLFENSERIILNTLISLPENEFALRLLASVYGEQGQYGCSYRVWKKISRKNNSDPFCYYELGHSALMIKNFAEAAKSFEWLLLLNPDFNPVAIYQLIESVVLDLPTQVSQVAHDGPVIPGQIPRHHPNPVLLFFLGLPLFADPLALGPPLPHPDHPNRPGIAVGEAHRGHIPNLYLAPVPLHYLSRLLPVSQC